MVGIAREIANKRLVFITGKGGVGKTTLALALAEGLALKGKRVHYIDIARDKRAQKVAEGRFNPGQSLAWHSLTTHIDSQEAFGEYIKSQVKLELLKNLIVNNRVLKHFFDVAPGLSELMILNALVKRMENSPEDIFVVDGHAFGHGFSLMHTPFLLDRFVKFGPIKTLIKSILRGLSEENCALIFVTLPRETPVLETLEYCQKFSQHIFSPHVVLLNMCFPDFGNVPEGVNDLLDHAARQVREDRRFREMLAENLAIPVVSVPVLSLSSFSLQFYTMLSQNLV
jgi:anion-transporting  ArsA/GET3 family ATPase